MTKKCIEAIKKHTTIEHEIYVYDNNSTYLVDGHFDYFSELYRKDEIAQVTFTTFKSTFNAFSKAASCNFFGLQHEQDPERDKYAFLLILDNDIILTPGWDKKIKVAWKFITKKKMNYIKVVGQRPGGIKSTTEHYEFNGMVGRCGTLGGSGLWTVRPNFFKDVGFLDLKRLVGRNKMHDQLYWPKLAAASKGKPYIMGLNQKLGIHCGRTAGSVCNVLTRNRTKKDVQEIVKFKHAEKNIESQTFDEFYESIINNQKLFKDW
jgi:hypothetical protein